MDTGKSNYHNLTVERSIESLGTSGHGLSSAEAQQRLGQFGPNELLEKEKISPLVLFLEQFKSFLVAILLVAAVVSGVLAATGEGDILEPILIGLIVLFAAALGFYQEYRSEKAMEALKQMAAPTASVIRDGEETTVAARELVPGDLVILRTGDKVPADARVIEAPNLRAQEAPLTGEPIPIEKIIEPIPGDVPLGDRKNMVYMGTAVVYGRGKALVASTGMNTEFGKIAGMLQSVTAPDTPLQVSLDKVGRLLGIACLSIVAVVSVLGLSLGLFESVMGALIWGVSLAVAAVPEALPAVVTISLAVGVQRMVKRHTLIRRLPAVETLGSTTFICSDKTGTLTQDKMTIRKIYAGNKLIDVTGVGYDPTGEFILDGIAYDLQQDPHPQQLLHVGTMCNDCYIVNHQDKWEIRGDPTEGALVVGAAKAGIWQDKLTATFPRMDEVPFSSERKRMTTVHDTPEGRLAYSKGAPEVILNSCTHIYQNNQERPITDRDREHIQEMNSRMAGDALRVLALAYKRLKDADTSAEQAERDMTFAGLVGIMDPPRDEVKDAIRVCHQAGIKTVMITGDHKLTAVAVGREIGLLDKDGIAITGAELDELSDEEFDRKVEKIQVYARVSPSHKMRVVEALQKRGHTVAMTGDGVNDAPALKKADIGVAMGITGTAVSKEAAAMVLTDDNFASIVAAVEEGRGVFSNIRKFLLFLLQTNIGEILLMLTAFIVAAFTGSHAIPLVALQLLFVNLVTDGLPAIALGVDPADPDIMQQPPRDPKEGIFPPVMMAFLVGAAIYTGIVTLGVFYWALGEGRKAEEAQTLVFVTIVLVELAMALNCRSARFSLFKIGFFANPWLILALATSFALTVVVVYVPFLQEPFHTYPMTLADWALPVGSAVMALVVVELAKLAVSWRSRAASRPAVAYES